MRRLDKAHLSDTHFSQEEVILPLSSDAAFLELLSGALAALANLYSSILKHCEVEVEALSRTISSSARPRSEGGKSDLDTWRSIFQLWVESEIFESVSERHHGEVDATEAEKRLKRFADEVIERGLDSKRAMRIVDGRDALNRFYGLNVLILDLKKVGLAAFSSLPPAFNGGWIVSDGQRRSHQEDPQEARETHFTALKRGPSIPRPHCSWK